MSTSRKYYLKFSELEAGVHCISVDDARARLQDVIKSQRIFATEVIELPSGRWLIRRPGSRSITVWIEDANGLTVQLNRPPV